MHIHGLDDDSLLQIFSCFRLEGEHDWYLRLAWRNLVQVCQRWRYLIYDSWSHLDLCLLLSNDPPSSDTPSYLPPLPVVITCSDVTGTMAQKGEDKIQLGLQQQHSRVRRVVFRAPSSSLRMWLEPMNKPFPILRDLSLFCMSLTTTEMSPVLPETLQAPDLRHLSLHGIGLPKDLSLLSSTIALSRLSLTHIQESFYFPPGQLVTRLQGLPHLEELSIGFAIPIPLPSFEKELLPAPIPPVTLHTLRQLTFHGEGVYLDNLVAQINTPLLERLSLALLFDPDFTLVHLNEFTHHRTQGSGCPVAQITFNKDGASIDAGYYEQQGTGKLSVHVNCKPLNWQIDSATQVCGALGKVLSAVKEFTLDLDVDGIPSSWENTLGSMMWHELLLPFTGVKKLHIGSSLTLELSRALESVTLELLPELQELELQLKIDHATNAFSSFVKFVNTRESVGRPVRLLVPPGHNKKRKALVVCNR